MMAVDPSRAMLTRRSIILTLPLSVLASRRVELYVFLAVECPISNRYVPELRRIHADYANRGIDFHAVFPEPALGKEKLHEWVKEFAVDFPVQLDEGQRLVAKLGATMTPEAAILVDGKLLYRGRIDDRYVSWGKSKPQATHRDVREVLDAILKGGSPPQRITKSWGCYIEKGSKS
jgi:hypothetical protein